MIEAQPFDFRLDRARLTIGYRVGLLAVVMLVVLLPLIYVAFIGAIVWLVRLHMAENADLLHSIKGSRRTGGALYFAPIVIGGMLIVFLLKPFLAKRKKSTNAIRLDPRREATLFDFVHGVCRAVGAPEPSHIAVDCQVNASAGFHEGRVFGRERVLTLGLPLIGGLGKSALAGVLAHEFGHFAQQGGMTLGLIVRKVLVWFYDAVHARDSWDEKLKRWASTMPGWFGFIIQLGNGCIWISRKLLGFLLSIGTLANLYLMRQMEYDADRYEIEMAGSSTFESTSKRLIELSIASQIAGNHQNALWQERRLCDDLPSLILHYDKECSDDVRRAAEEQVRSRSSDRYDTHPATKDRIAAARELNAAGHYVDDSPASELMQDFEGLCIQATERDHREILGRHYRADAVVTVGSIVEERSTLKDEGAALDRYFQGTHTLRRPWALAADVLESPPDPALAARELKALRDATRTLEESALTECVRYGILVGASERAAAAHRLFEKKLPCTPIDFGFRSTQPAKLKELESAIRDETDRLRTKLEACDRRNAMRLESALSLLHVETIGRRLDDAEGDREAAARLWPLLRRLTSNAESMLHIEELNTSLLAFIATISKVEAKEPVYREAVRIARDTATTLTPWLEEAEHLGYPFEHGRGEVTLRTYLGGTKPETTAVADWARFVGTVLERTLSLHHRTLATLASIAERVEAAMGLSALPAPRELTEEEIERITKVE